MNNLPREIRLAGRRWQVVRHTPEGTLGLTNENTHTIHVTAENCIEVQLETLLHELQHAMSSMYGVVPARGADADEHIATRNGYALTDLVLSNPELMAFLTELSYNYRNTGGQS